MQHSGEPRSLLLAGRQPEWHAGSLDALLGAADALRHGRFGNQKRLGDFGRSQSAHRPQGQGNRRRGSQGGMAAHEEQGERVVVGPFPSPSGSGASALISAATTLSLRRRDSLLRR